MKIFADVDTKNQHQNGIVLLERIEASVAEAGDIHVPA